MWEVLCSVRSGGSEIGSTVTATADSALATSVDELARANVGVHQLEDFVSVWATQRASFAWFLGAGVSASAGVPTAKPRSTCVTNVEGSVIGELLKAMLYRR